MIAMLVVLLVVVVRLTVKSDRQTILDYQRGIRFNGGKPQAILGPGCYRFRPANEQITVVDLRDQPVIVERFAYRDSASENAWISISAAIHVVDAHRATTQCHDHVNEAVVSIRDVLRGLSARRASEARRDRRGCEQELTTQMASELEKIGLALTGLEITEVSSPATDRVVGFPGVH
jgi:uncharacterized membrane protein YqiK